MSGSGVIETPLFQITVDRRLVKQAFFGFDPHCNIPAHGSPPFNAIDTRFGSLYSIAMI
jgi:hypothetical protein